MAREVSLVMSVDDKGSVTLKRFGGEVEKLTELVKKLSAEATGESVTAWTRWGNALSQIFLKLGMTVVNVMTTMIKTSLVLGAVAIGAFVGGATLAFDKLGRSVVSVGESFRQFSLTLEGALKSTERAKELSNFAQEFAMISPARLQDIQTAIKSFALMPQTVWKLKGPIKDVKADLSDMVDTIIGLATVDPTQGVPGAIFAVREALGGQFRSLAWRFELPMDILEQISGKSNKELKKDPGEILQTLKMFVDQFVGSETLRKFARLPTVLAGNISDSFIRASKLIGDAGIYDKLVGILAAVSDRLTDFITLEFGDKFAGRISKAMERTVNALQATFQVIARALGIETFEQGFSSAAELITQGFEKIADVMEAVSLWFIKNRDALKEMVTAWQSQLSGFFEFMQQGMSGIGSTFVTAMAPVVEIVGQLMAMVMRASDTMGFGPESTSKKRLYSFLDANAGQFKTDLNALGMPDSEMSLMGTPGGRLTKSLTAWGLMDKAATATPGTSPDKAERLGRMQAYIAELQRLETEVSKAPGLADKIEQDSMAAADSMRKAFAAVLGVGLGGGGYTTTVPEFFTDSQGTTINKSARDPLDALMKRLDASEKGRVGIERSGQLIPRDAFTFTGRLSPDMRAKYGVGSSTSEETEWQTAETNRKESWSEMIRDLEMSEGVLVASLTKTATKVNNAMENAFSETLFSLIKGRFTSLEQVITSFADTVVKAFTDMAAELAVKGLFSSILGSANSLFGYVLGEPMPASLTPPWLDLANPVQGAASGGVFRGGWTPVRAFAAGGVVTSPTMGLVGEAGQNEAVVPLPDGRNIPVSLQGGARAPEVTIINTMDPGKVVMAGLATNPNMILNPILADVRAGGPIFQSIMQRARLTR